MLVSVLNLSPFYAFERRTDRQTDIVEDMLVLFLSPSYAFERQTDRQTDRHRHFEYQIRTDIVNVLVSDLSHLYAFQIQTDRQTDILILNTQICTVWISPDI